MLWLLLPFVSTGEDAVPKKIPKTTENQRVPDETTQKDPLRGK